MENPYAAPSTDITKSEYDVAGAAPYTVAQMRSAFTRFAWSYWGYIGSILLMVVFVVVLVAQVASSRGSSSQMESQVQGVAIGFGLFMFVFLGVAICMMVFAMILLYRYWAVMQPYSSRTTPGKAVGFLFIPLFNLYWVFVAYHGLAKDIDEYLDKNRDSQAPRPSTNLVLAMAIMMVMTMVPYLGNLASLALVVLLFITKQRLNNSIIGIIQDRARRQASAAPTK